MKYSWMFILLCALFAQPAVARHHHHGHIKDPLPEQFDQDVVIIDVRSTHEYEAEHVVGARHIYYQTIGDKIAALGLAKDRQILVYCAVGVRASRAQQTLKRLGYSNVVNMGGLEDMLAAGFKSEE